MDVKDEKISINQLCHACLCVGKYVNLITDEKLKKYYLDALAEIPLNNTKIVNITLCWECKAFLQKCCTFKEQVKDCYRILQTYTYEDLNEYLFTDVSRPPLLTIHKTEPINIAPTDSEECQEPAAVNVKDELGDNSDCSKEDSVDHNKDNWLSDTIDNDDTMDHVKEEELAIETKLQTIICTIDKGSKKSNGDIKSKVKRSTKIVKSLKEKTDLNEYLFTDVSRPPLLTIHKTEPINIAPTDSEECQEPAAVNVKDELGDNSDCSKEDSVDHNKDNWLSDTIDNDDTMDHVKEEELAIETKLQTIICTIDKGSKKSNGDIKSKVKRSTKIVKSLKEKTSKRQKVDSKVVTIDLSYEEMMQEREMESKRDSYMRAEYKCETCLIGFNYKKSYQTHVNTKHSVNLGEYICPICKTIISSVDSFTAHYKRHMRRYECIICQKRTADLKVMQQHYFTTHKISLKEYKCNICGKISSSIDTHRYHKDTHKSRVQCTECDKTFRHRAGLMNHRLAVHELRNAYPCTVCDKVFKWKTSLKRHLEKHDSKSVSAPAPYCSTCSISFASLCSYQRHLKNSLKHVTQDQLKFICDHCNRRFSDKTKLRDHIEEKHLFKTFTCHICSKPSKNRVGLDQHIRNVHKGRPKNKMCHHCGRGFPTKIQLESHIRTHTGERPFICEFCPTTFSQQSNLYKHSRQVHMNIKSKRYPMCKKNKDVTEQIVKVTSEHPENVLEDTYRPIVLQYSPERGFVL